jgi:L-proline amide hydrolase
MSSTESTTGQPRAPKAVEGHLERSGLSTWYRMIGDPTDPRPPIVLCHGGPGATHDYLEPLEALASDGRRCVFYDQVGGGRSSHHQDVPHGFWTVGLFVDELEALVAHLHLDRYHLLGQSWGAMLGLEFALRRPAGLQSLVLANGLASVPRYASETAELLAHLPTETAAALVHHGRHGTTDTPEFGAAIEEFSRRHRLRLDAMPDCLQRTNAAMGTDMTVYTATVGSEFHITGTLATWDVTPRLGQILLPVLLISGRHDEVTPPVVEEIHHGIPRSEWVVFEDGSHMTHLEDPGRFVETVTEFVNRVEES